MQDKPHFDDSSRERERDRALIEAAKAWAVEQPQDLTNVPSRADLQSTGQLSTREIEPNEEATLPERLGRYIIIRQLGKGGFGVVYLAHDPQLDRQVALKVPRRERFRSAEQVANFIQEARATAKLKHPLLVTIHDVQEEGGLPFIVQEYIEGENLAEWSAKHRPTYEQIVQVIVGVAEALGYAHGQRLTHCDLKLANVLLDRQGQPHVADFGLAVHESARLDRKGARFGTPPMMAPEQVRGEGHRLDGRTDIWGIGVMMYQMLVSQRPFTATDQHELFNEIETLDPRPPRQIDRSVPRELERICLKCLSKRRTERYNTTDDLREDLQLWLSQDASTQVPRSSTVVAPARIVPDSESSSKPPVKIIPKGLRSFDAEDTNFFLELLPGPRDREGLPESIRFWKNRIEERDPDRTFSVGLIYGPSGCGKSSLVKAGLLPRLSPQVLAIYVEATADETELRIMKQFRKYFPRLSDDLSLPDACAELRRSGAGRDCKVLVVIDQFEQWLHTHTDLSQTTLLSALRQCDGGRLQTILLVRDDFFVSVNRLFRELEAPLLEGHNYALVDRFDRQHAQKLLTAFGRAYGKLDDELTPTQKQFVSQAVEELVEEDKIISVRLSLFADMMKMRPWSLVSLNEVGGVGGVGVTFLDETFDGKAAPPPHREHAAAIRQVLKALLPESGTDIKGGMRSVDTLRQASGYGLDERRFNEAIRILDGELRIITPTDPNGDWPSHDSTDVSGTASRYYQLTHDYLVPALRQWLTRKQRETRRGRAELKLADRAATWSVLRENKLLPTFGEWLNIGLLTDRNRRTEPQRAMMSKATRVHSLRAGFAAAALFAMIAVSLVIRSEVVKQQEATRVEGLVGRLVRAAPNQLPAIVQELHAQRDVAAVYLSPFLASDATTPDETRAQLHARLARVTHDRSHVNPLLEELLNGKLTYVGPIRQQLQSYAIELTDTLWAVLRDKSTPADRRFRAALALADYVPVADGSAWLAEDVKFVARQLVAANAEFQPMLRELLRPIDTQLLPDLEAVFGDEAATKAQRLSSANAFADYAGSDIVKLSELLTIATPEQDAVLFPLMATNRPPLAVDYLAQTAATLPPDELGTEERVPFGQRRANAAVTLLRLGELDKVFPVFDMTDDPEALTQFIFRCHPCNVSIDSLLDCLKLVSDAPRKYPADTRYALLLTLGEYPLEMVPESRRAELLKQLADWYASDPSSGVHGASGWLLRRWGQAETVRRVDHTAVPYSIDREWFTLAISVNAATDADASNSRSATTSVEGETFYYTFIVFPAGDGFIGSVEDEPSRSPQDRELRHRVTLPRPFAVLNREITWEELIAFNPVFEDFRQQAGCDIADAGTGVDWYDSIMFCRWLGQQLSLPEVDQPYASPESFDSQTYPRDPDPRVNWAPRDWPVELDRRGFRLPTEAEWEVAARAGARTAYGHGSDVSLLTHYCWYIQNSGEGPRPPAQLRRSRRGLFDLHGNVNEKVHDWYTEFTADAATDPTGPESRSNRVSRGGSFTFAAAFCRSALRYAEGPTLRTTFGGFRLALSPPPSESGVVSQATER